MERSKTIGWLALAVGIACAVVVHLLDRRAGWLGSLWTIAVFLVPWRRLRQWWLGER
jgi:hypothetical protein